MKTEYEQQIEALQTEYERQYHALKLELEQCEGKYWDARCSGDTAGEIECEKQCEELELRIEQIGQEYVEAKRRTAKAAFNALSPKEQLEAKIGYSMRQTEEEWDISSHYYNELAHWNGDEWGREGAEDTRRRYRKAARRAYLYEKRTKKLLKEQAKIAGK
jgi:hypothetical protein